MKDERAQELLARVMEWKDRDAVLRHVYDLQLLAYHKYDSYQRFGPGRRFIESLALWLQQLDPEDRAAAFELVKENLVFISENEMSHLVQTAYADLIVQERMRLVAEEQGIPTHRIGALSRHVRFKELKAKSLYLGLSDGARTNELRRASDYQISNEQIWQAYEVGEQKAESMLTGLKKTLIKKGLDSTNPRFNLIWLLDDFSGSGNTYIRYDSDKRQFEGKLQRIYDQIHEQEIITPGNYEVFLLLYVASRQAIDHIEYWTERFTSQRGYKPLQVRVLFVLERELALTHKPTPAIKALLAETKYFDPQAVDSHLRVGGADGRLGFANCALPVVLTHNTPNNSVYLLWGPDDLKYPGLFPRVVRHRDDPTGGAA